MEQSDALLYNTSFSLLPFWYISNNSKRVIVTRNILNPCRRVIYLLLVLVSWCKNYVLWVMSIKPFPNCCLQTSPFLTFSVKYNKTTHFAGLPECGSYCRYTHSFRCWTTDSQPLHFVGPHTSLFHLWRHLHHDEVPEFATRGGFYSTLVVVACCHRSLPGWGNIGQVCRPICCPPSWVDDDRTGV